MYIYIYIYILDSLRLLGYIYIYASVYVCGLCVLVCVGLFILCALFRTCNN